MSQISGYRPALTPARYYRPPARIARVAPPAPTLAPAPVEGRFPTFLGFMTAAYLVSVTTMGSVSTAISWVPQVVGITLGISWVIVGLFIKGQPIRWTGTMSLFVLYAVWAATGMVKTTNIDYFMVLYGTQIKVCTVTWVCFQCVKTRRDFLLCCLFQGFASILILIQGLDSIVRAVEASGVKFTKDARAEGTLLSSPNTLGEFALIVIVGAIACFLGNKNIIIRVMCMAFIAVGLYMVAASGSRTAMLAVVLVAMSIYWYHFRKAGGAGVGAKVVITFFSLFLVAGSILFVTKIPLFHRLQDSFSSKDELEKEARVQYFFRAVAATMENPIMGLGMGGFALAKLGMTIERTGHYSHSTVSETLSCTGIPGFLMYFGAMFAMYKLIKRTRNLPLPKLDMAAVNAIMTLFWVVLLQNSVGVMDQNRLIWPLVGAALGYVWNLQQNYSQAVPRPVAV